MPNLLHCRCRRNFIFRTHQPSHAACSQFACHNCQWFNQSQKWSDGIVTTHFTDTFCAVPSIYKPFASILRWFEMPSLSSLFSPHPALSVFYIDLFSVGNFFLVPNLFRIEFPVSRMDFPLRPSFISRDCLVFYSFICFLPGNWNPELPDFYPPVL